VLVFFFTVLAIYLISPVIISSDSHFVLPTALSIVRHGDANIDEYHRQFPDAPWAMRNQNGHYWNVYPIGVPFLVVPMTWIADRIDTVFGKDLEASATQKSPFFLELVFASLITAGAAVLLFYHVRCRLSLPRSLLLGFFFALGTSAYSFASRGLWQHASMLLLTAAILLYDRLAIWGARGAGLLGIVVGYSYAVRPSNLAAIAGFAVLLAVTARRLLVPYLAGAALGVMPLFAFHLTAYGTWSSYYYEGTQSGLLSLSLPLKPLAASGQSCLTILCPRHRVRYKCRRIGFSNQHNWFRPLDVPACRQFANPCRRNLCRLGKIKVLQCLHTRHLRGANPILHRVPIPLFALHC
jgi:hypothetical protein